MLRMRKLFLKKQNSSPCCKLDYIGNDRGISTSDIIITIVSVIIIIVSTIFLVSNIITLRNVNQEIDEIKETIDAKQEALDQLIDLGKSEDMLREDYDRSELYIPNERDEIGITKDLTSIIIDNDGLFRSLDLGEEVVLENGITDITLSLRFDCTYDNLTHIINEISKTERLYVVDSINIVDSSTADLSADIKVHAFYREN